MKLFIVNDFDKPCERFLAYLTMGGQLRYIHDPEWPLMDPNEATNLLDFGFSCFHQTAGTYEYRQERPSAATYKNGSPRRWQGAKEFYIFAIGDSLPEMVINL